MMEETITINDTEVTLLRDGYWSVHKLLSLAVHSEEFSIEHEQEADYGRLMIYTLNDGLYVYLREIDEHQIEDEPLGDRFGLAFARTEDVRDRRDEEGEYYFEIIARYWKIEVFESETDEESEAA